MNKKLYIIAIIMLGSLIIGCESKTGNQNIETSLHYADMTEYGIVDGHNFIQIGMDEALKLTQDSLWEGILYFGFPTCPWCQAAVPIMNEAALQSGINIYYVSRAGYLREGIWLEWDEEMAWFLHEQIDNMRWIYENDVAIRPNINVPQIVHLKGGVVIDQHRGTFEEHVRLEDRTLPELTDYQKEELLNRYLEIFNEVQLQESCPLVVEQDECS